MPLHGDMKERSAFVGEFMRAHRDEYKGGRGDPAMARVMTAAQAAFRNRHERSNPSLLIESAGEAERVEMPFAALLEAGLAEGLGIAVGLAGMVAIIGALTCTHLAERSRWHGQRACG